jgi:hypothetical protein
VTNATDMTSPTNEAAALRIVRGEPSPEELAALVAVLAARSAAGSGEPAAPRNASGWTDRARYVRSGRVEFGARGGWRASVLPR